MVYSFVCGAVLQFLPETQGVRAVRIISGVAALVMVAVILFRRHRESAVQPRPQSHELVARLYEPPRRPANSRSVTAALPVRTNPATVPQFKDPAVRPRLQNLEQVAAFKETSR
jgi:hypothetical protein